MAKSNYAQVRHLWPPGEEMSFELWALISHRKTTLGTVFAHVAEIFQFQ